MHPDGKAYGGTALIIRSNIKYYEIGKYQRDFLQSTCIMIEEWLYYHFCRSPPKHIINNEQYITLLEILGDLFIVTEYYNAKHVQWKSILI